MDELRSKLFYEQKNGYDLIDTDERIAVEDYCGQYMSYLNDSRTEREAVKNAIALAEEQGFVEYELGMELKPGMRIYRNNRGKALMLAVIGKKSLAEGAVIAGAHVDSPRLDLKQITMYETCATSRRTTTAASKSTSGSPFLWSCTALSRSRAARPLKSPSAVSRASLASS